MLKRGGNVNQEEVTTGTARMYDGIFDGLPGTLLRSNWRGDHSGTGSSQLCSNERNSLCVFVPLCFSETGFYGTPLSKKLQRPEVCRTNLMTLPVSHFHPKVGKRCGHLVHSVILARL